MQKANKQSDMYKDCSPVDSENDNGDDDDD